MKTPQFTSQESYTPRSDNEKTLIKILTSITSERSMANLLRDLLTLPELKEFANRLEIAKLLLEKKPYTEIAKKTRTSTTTVTRVAHWLYNGCGGYWKALQKK